LVAGRNFGLLSIPLGAQDDRAFCFTQELIAPGMDDSFWPLPSCAFWLGAAFY